MSWQQMLAMSVQNALPSCIRILGGVAVAFALGVMLACLRYSLPARLQKNFLFNFLLEAPRYPPPIAWIPFVILLAGIGELSATIIVVIGAFFPIFTSTYAGLQAIPRALLWSAQSLDLPRLRYIREILLPAALPQILGGLRIGLGMGWMSVIAAEMVSGDSGLGYSIQLERMNMQYRAMLLDIVLIGLIGFVLSLAMNALEKRLLGWTDVIRT